MSFEDLDTNFDKIAKTPRQTNVQRQTAAELAAAEEEKQEFYEESFRDKQIHGLLAKFQEKLKNRSSQPSQEESNDFETIHITSNSIIPTTPESTEEVSEEDIDNLMNPKKPKYSEGFDNIDTSVEQTISTHTRYDSIHPTIENNVKPEDLPKQQAILNDVDRPSIQRTANEQISDEEVAHHLAEHNRKKAERITEEESKVTETTEETINSETE